MSADLALAGLQGMLALALGGVLVGSLRFLRRVERYVPPLGARRIHYRWTVGERLPLERLPADLASLAASGDLLFLFAGPFCGLCRPLLESLPSFARSYSVVRFVVCSPHPWEAMDRSAPPGIRFLHDPEFVAGLGITLQPYALRVVRGVVAEYGVVNEPEHLESILAARVGGAP
jgi:hypothetical protein